MLSPGAWKLIFEYFVLVNFQISQFSQLFCESQDAYKKEGKKE